MNQIESWKKLDNFSRDRHQQIVDHLNYIARLPDAQVGVQTHIPDEPRIMSSVIARPLTASPRGGGYFGKIWIPKREDVDDVPETGGPIALTDYGFDPADFELEGYEAFILNAPETGQSSHDLLAAEVTNKDAVYPGVVIGRNDSSGRWVVVITGVPWKACA